jgi:hypothetical protein
MLKFRLALSSRCCANYQMKYRVEKRCPYKKSYKYPEM